MYFFFHKIYIEHAIYDLHLDMYVHIRITTQPYTKYVQTQYTHSVVPPFLYDILIAKYMNIYLNGAGWCVLGGVVDIASLHFCLCLHHHTPPRSL